VAKETSYDDFVDNPSVAAEIVEAKLAPSQATPHGEQGLFERVTHSRLAVLGVLFLMTGFLGLPLLWMNPRFSNMERWLWAVIVTIYTCILIALAGWIVMWSWNSISNSL